MRKERDLVEFVLLRCLLVANLGLPHLKFRQIVGEVITLDVIEHP